MLAIDSIRKFNSYTKQSLIRKRIPIQKRDKNKIVINNQHCINFCSNDYLGLATCDIIKESFMNAACTYGFGSSSSALISGYFSVQQELEERFSRFLNRDKVILFNSGYLANIGTITALSCRNSVIISDKFCHASILDGIHLSKAKHYRFHHNNTTHLKHLLRNKSKYENTLVLTEGIFSMGGDLSLIQEIVEQTKLNHATLIVDDAHGIGILGKNGGGICEIYQLTQIDIPCLITPLGKAFGGLGAMVSGKAELIETILQFARSYRYTTALPPAVCAVLLKVLDVVENEHWRREILNDLVQYFIEQVKERKLPLISYDQTPIKCFLVANNDTVQKIQQEMLGNGFFISSIRPPTVPKGTARIRISLNVFHTKEQIEQLLDNLVLMYAKHTL